ncbi:MAG: polysaccharide deacetylase family protein [Actinomycetota bacterium]
MRPGALVHRTLRRHVRVMGSILAVRTDEPVVVMTFDDGPEPPHTERVLTALRDHGAHATFFMLSGRAERHPELVREVVSEGHEVALHGMDHVPLRTLSSDEITRRTRAGREALEDIAGAEVRWHRPPYGGQSPRTYRAVRRAGLMPVLWGGTSRDSADTTTAARMASALRAAQPGTILLCHDGRAGPDAGVDDGEIPAFDRGALTTGILSAFEARGLAGTSLERALVNGSPRAGAWFG